MIKISRIYRNDLYPLRIINTAIKSYSSIAKIKTKLKDKDCICTFSEKKIPIQEVVDEFGNYLIDLQNNNYDDSL